MSRNRIPGESGRVTSAAALFLAAATLLSARSVSAGELIFTDPGFADDVAAINFDGSGFSDLFVFPAIVDPRGLAVDVNGGKAYFTSGSALYRGNLDGTGLELLISALGGVPSDVELDLANDTVYWSVDGPTGGIRRANLDGTGATVLVTQTLLDSLLGVDPDVRADRVGGIEIRGGRVYWSNLAGLNSMPTSGVTVGTDALNQFVLASGEVSKIALDPAGSTVYFTNNSGSTVQKIGLDGSGLTTLVSRGFGRPAGLAIDFASERLFFGDTLGTSGRGQILSANLDGSDLTIILDRGSTLFAPVDLELGIPVPEPQAWHLATPALAAWLWLAARRRRGPGA